MVILTDPMITFPELMADYYVDDLLTPVYQFELFNHNNSNYLIWVLLSERETERDRERHRETEGERQRETERDTERHRERHRERDTERERSAINNVWISNDTFINWWKE